MSYLKPQVSFSLNIASLFSVVRDNPSVLFWLKLYMIWTKETHQSAKFKTFDCSHEISPNLYFDSLLLFKAYTISAKKSMEDLRIVKLRTDAKFDMKLEQELGT